MKSRRTVILFCTIILSINVYTASSLIVTSTNEQKPISSVTEAMSTVEKKLKSNAQVFEEINVSTILSKLKTTGKFVLSLPDRDITLNLNEKDYNLDSSEEIYFYNGFVENYENSEAYLTLDNHRISGRIEFPTKDRGIQSYSISHISDYINPKINEKSPIHIIRQLNKFNNTAYDQVTNSFYELTEDDIPKSDNNSDYTCCADQEQENGIIRTLHDRLSSISASGYYAKVKIFADYYYYQHYGDTNWYYMDEVNYVIGKWGVSEQQNPDIQISVKTTDVWTSTSEGGGCYSATSMSDLLSKFRSWGNSQGIFGTWSGPGPGDHWNGDTDFALLMTGKDWADYLGMAYYQDAGVYNSGTYKYALCEIWPGLFTEIVAWGISHEWGHLFAGHHDAAHGGPWGHRAWAWCDAWFFGICTGYRQTNMWYGYIFLQASIGVFSKANVDGASSAENNIYYIRQWRNNYLRS
ncbi:MAG: hypothetical protein ACFFFG_15865 [Candidatus Thorarchaeota archaeon]